MSRSIWTTLGIGPTNDATEIKRAYARRLKEVHPEDDPEGFQALRAAYDQAANMARKGWAVPTPVPARAVIDDGYDDEDAELGGWAPSPERDWSRDVPEDAPRGWAPPEGERWTRDEGAGRATAEVALPDDIRAELARERDLAEAHQALCDQLTALVANADGDRQEALSAMIRVFRSPAMDSLSTYARTEQWLAHVVGYGGPVVDEMVEPVIHFFGWDSRRVGVDLRHAEPVLRRREATLVLRRLERSIDPDFPTWQALKRKPTRQNRMFGCLTPNLAKRVQALLQRLEYEHPELIQRLDPDTVARWRARLARPGLGPIFLWTLLLAPPFLALVLNTVGDFGPPTWATMMSFWTVIGSAWFGLGVANLYGVSRPRQAWRSSDPWGRPLWVRFGWAPAALLLPLVAGLIPTGSPVAALLLTVPAAGLWAWARITTGHIARPHGVAVDWGLLAGLAPILAYLLTQLQLIDGAPLIAAFLCCAAVLQTGADAIADELAHRSVRERRFVGAGQLALSLVAAAAVVAGALTDLALAATTGLVVALALGDRALAWHKVGPLLVGRRFVLLVGWIGGFIAAALMPLKDFEHQAFAGLGLWLLTASALTALAGLTEGLNVLPERFRRKKNKRAPGSLA